MLFNKVIWFCSESRDPPVSAPEIWLQLVPRCHPHRSHFSASRTSEADLRRMGTNFNRRLWLLVGPPNTYQMATSPILFSENGPPVPNEKISSSSIPRLPRLREFWTTSPYLLRGCPKIVTSCLCSGRPIGVVGEYPGSDLWLPSGY